MEIIKVNEFLRVCDELANKPINIKTAYKLAKLRASLQSEADFYNSKLQSIIQKYGEVDEEGNFIFTDNGNGVKIKPDMLSACQAEVEELENLDITKPDIRFSLDEFDGFDLTLAQTTSLLDFIED
jgi:hypothetical protein